MRARKNVPTLEYERAFWRDGFARVAALDEAGRGALAGPVVAAAIILPPIHDAQAEQWRRHELFQAIAHVNDSKQLSEPAREQLFAPLSEIAVAYAVGSASPREIDELNILRASHLAMHRALQQLSPPPRRAIARRARFGKHFPSAARHHSRRRARAFDCRRVHPCQSNA